MTTPHRHAPQTALLVQPRPYDEPDPSRKEKAEGDRDEPNPYEQGWGTPGFDPADEEKAEGDDLP